MVTDANTWFQERRDVLEGHIMLAHRANDKATMTRLRDEIYALGVAKMYFDKEVKRIGGGNGR